MTRALPRPHPMSDVSRSPGRALRRATVALTLCGAIGGCSPDSPLAVAPVDEPRLAKGGPTTSVADSRAILTWDDLAIRSDGGGAYEGDVQGVKARLFYYDINGSRSGDLVFDPDASQSSAPRKLIFVFPTGQVATGTAFNFWGLMQLGSTTTDSLINVKNPGTLLSAAFPDLSAVQPDYPTRAKPHPEFRFMVTGVSGCGTLSHASIRLTRTSGSFVPTSNGMGKWAYENEPGSWVVESVATDRNGQLGHWATCLTTVKNKTVENGTYDMPFRVVVQERR